MVDGPFQVSLLEEELSILKAEEMERSKVLQDLGSQRDRVALAIANKLAKVRTVNHVGGSERQSYRP